MNWVKIDKLKKSSLLQCSVGDELQIRVGGDFFYAPPTPNSATDLLLIAGGVGINPLISMLRHHVWLLSKAKPSEDCHGNGAVQLLYSAKNENELIFKVCCKCTVLKHLHTFLASFPGSIHSFSIL